MSHEFEFFGEKYRAVSGKDQPPTLEWFDREAHGVWTPIPPESLHPVYPYVTAMAAEILRLAERVREMEADREKLAAQVRKYETSSFEWQELAEQKGARIAALEAHLDGTRKILRSECADLGDNDWPDNLHLGDVVEKHLGRPVRHRIEALEAENAALRGAEAVPAEKVEVVEHQTVEGLRFDLLDRHGNVTRSVSRSWVEMRGLHDRNAMYRELLAPREPHTGAPGCSSETRDTDSSG